MHRITSLCLLVSLGAALPAQTKTTSPPGYETFVGERFSSGAICLYPDSRWQYADGNFKGRRAMVLSRFAFRHDNARTYNTSSGIGRTWTNVTLRMSDCDFLQTGNTFSRNVLGTATVVYNASLKVATKTGSTSPNKPEPFNAVALPFTTVWIYTAKQDLLFDFVLRGGKLANNASWSTSFLGQAYVLDAIEIALGRVGSPTQYRWKGCVDPAAAGYRDYAECWPHFVTFGKVTGSKVTSNKHYLRSISYGTAPYAPIVHAIGLKGQAKAVTFPGASSPCNKLHLDVSGRSPVLYVFGRTRGDYFGGVDRYFPYTPGAVGVTIWTQAAWNDSKTKAFTLTGAGKTTVPRQPQWSLKRVFYGRSSTSTTGIGHGTWGHPLYELTYR